MPRMFARIGKGAGFAALALLVTGFGVWGACLLAFSGPANEPARIALASFFGFASASTLVALFVRRWRWPVMAGFAAMCAGLIAYWASIEPSNDRDWQPEVALLPYATISGDEVTVHNIRNFDYRSETDYTIAYYDKRFDLRQLRSVDLIASYWMGPAIAHVFVSFGFAGDDYLAVSIEVRKSKGTDYSTLKGIFRQYELAYVAADERDIIRLRTNYRRNPLEDVYVYRIRGSRDDGRRLFMQYINRMNELRARPEFYNTLIANCTTGIWMNDSVNPNRVPLSWEIVLTGYVPEYLYSKGQLDDMGLSFAELQRRAHINSRARAADSSANFSRRIRTWGEVQEATDTRLETERGGSTRLPRFSGSQALS